MMSHSLAIGSLLGEGPVAGRPPYPGRRDVTPDSPRLSFQKVQSGQQINWHGAAAAGVLAKKRSPASLRSLHPQAPC